MKDSSSHAFQPFNLTEITAEHDFDLRHVIALVKIQATLKCSSFPFTFSKIEYDNPKLEDDNCNNIY